ncbi:MAG: hypothetical protein ABL974_23050, partial [Prosthecobacter sp.]
MESLIARAPSLVVDVGAAEGYYAVGLARRLPSAQIIAFEMEEHGQKALHEMAQLNNVTSRLHIRGRCEPADLAEALGTELNAVVVCDVEGYE